MQVQNPILRGWHPDPCFCSARGKYYLATSTFQWVPGVSLYESDDLVVWKSVGGALRDLDLRGIPDSAGVWAPDLTYDEESGLFWLVYTIAKQIDGIFKDVENYVVTALLSRALGRARTSSTRAASIRGCSMRTGTITCSTRSGPAPARGASSLQRLGDAGIFARRRTCRPGAQGPGQRGCRQLAP